MRDARLQERLGSAQWQRDFPRALEHYTRFEELVGEALERMPDDPEAQTLLPLATVKKSDAMWRMNRREEALEGYDTAWERLRAVSDTRPGWGDAAMGLVAARVVVGERLLLEGNLSAAEESFRKAKDVALEWTRRTPRDPRALRMVWWTSKKNADAAILRGNYFLADSHLHHARQVLASGVDLSGRMFGSNQVADAAAVERIQGLAKLRAAGDRALPRADAYQTLADAGLAFQDFAIVHVYFTRAIETRAPGMAEADRPTRERQAQALHRLGLVNKELNREEEYLRHALAAQALAKELLSEAWSRSVAIDVASGHLILGTHHEDAGDPDAARRQFQQSLDYLGEINRRGPLDERARELRRILASKGFEL